MPLNGKIFEKSHENLKNQYVMLATFNTQLYGSRNRPMPGTSRRSEGPDQLAVFIGPGRHLALAELGSQ